MKAASWIFGIVSITALLLGSFAIWRTETRALDVPRDRGSGARVTSGAGAAATNIVVEPSTPAEGTPPSPSVQPRDTNTPSGALRIRRLVVARGIEGREPAETAQPIALSEHTPIYAFVEIENRGDEGETIFVTFEPEGGDWHDAVGHVELEAPVAARWRTWGLTRSISEPGTWTAIVRNADGDMLASETFEVVD